MTKERCARCGDVILSAEEREHQTDRIGSGRVPTCVCPRPTTRRATSRREPTQNITYVAPPPSIADQLAVLAKLVAEGALTREEFQTLKTRLISGGKS